ncbi:teichuronic acid biosynthesis glycosyltransferase TuaG [mine drainage metagenome]|uniref:Teichuronic acid biosynthesis glycosyltransferase TuaG n=1 Tax=mine drainage metagenome TaxID=410659 RepID=T0ZX58_9ZZZZ
MNEVGKLESKHDGAELHFGLEGRPDVSIIVRTYESEKFIGDALTSISNQDFVGSIEVVINYPRGTKDNTIDRVYEFINSLAKSKKHNISVTIVSTRKMNASEAFREDIRHATGKYTATLDYDNVYTENKLSAQIGFMKANGLHFSFTNYDMADINLNKIRFMLHKPGKDYRSFDSLLKKFFVDANTVVFDDRFKRLLFKAYDVIDPLPLYKDIFDDYLMGFIALFTGNLNLLEKSLVLYRVSGFNSSVLKGGEPKEVVFDRNVRLNAYVQKTFAAFIRINDRLHLTSKRLGMGSTLNLSSRPLKASFSRYGIVSSGRGSRARR